MMAGFEKACERRMEEGRGDFQGGETGEGRMGMCGQYC